MRWEELIGGLCSAILASNGIGAGWIAAEKRSIRGGIVVQSLQLLPGDTITSSLEQKGNSA